MIKELVLPTAAAEMSLSVHTVRFHLRNVYFKLEVHSKFEAVAKALGDWLILYLVFEPCTGGSEMSGANHMASKARENLKRKGMPRWKGSQPNMK